MEWCDENGIDFVFGLAGNDVLRRLVEPIADDVRVRRAEAAAMQADPRITNSDGGSFDAATGKTATLPVSLYADAADQ